MIAKSHVKVKQTGEAQLRSFQFCKWQVQIPLTTKTLVSIYHPMYNNKTKVTNAEFLDEYMDGIAETLANDKNLHICEDYNLYVNNPKDEDAVNFLDMTIKLGLKQHLKFVIHTLGNRHDLIFMEVISEIGIAEFKLDSSISDHCNVLCTLTLKREDIQRKTITYRKLKDIDIDRMTKWVKATCRSDGNLVERLMDFDKALRNAFIIHAPLQKKQITICKIVPWFTDDVRELKKP